MRPDMGWRSIGAGLILAMGAAAAAPCRAASPHPVRAPHAMVASAESIASGMGVQILQAGGNAVDATVAVGFALAVTYPQAGNLAGGGFSVVRTADGRVVALDYRETAPEAASRNMYVDATGKVDDHLSREGFLAAGVPGTVAGLYELHRKLGHLPFDKLLEPARELAEAGFAVPYSLAQSLREEKDLLGSFPESDALFLRNGKFFEEGELFKQPALAATIATIQRDGPAAYYRGRIAKEIAEVVGSGGGLITREDLESYKPVWREPIRLTYRGYEMYSMPPPSSGGIILAQVLNTLEPVDLRSLGFHSSRAVHWIAEAMRRAYCDRARFLGDPDFVRIDAAKLTSKEYAVRLRETIDPARATASSMLEGRQHEALETTHYCVVDAAGNAVSTTYTLNGAYGCGRMAAGMLFNNEMDDFSASPGHPNMYGLVGSEANSIQPRKRMLSSMTPTIVVKDGNLMGVVGSPGGSTIPTTVIQILINLIDHGMDIQEAIDQPRFHHQYLPDQIKVEPRCLTADGISALEAMGHKIVVADGTWGDAQGIWFDPEAQMWLGASDSRRWGRTIGY
ncbi:MAG: gamma-glutamyltransferase [Acidobacteriota bacterium]